MVTVGGGFVAVAVCAASPPTAGAGAIVVIVCVGEEFGITILGSDRTARYVRRVSAQRIRRMYVHKKTIRTCAEYERLGHFGGGIVSRVRGQT